MLLRRSLWCVFLLRALCTFAAEPTRFNDLHWRLLGPFRAGRVLAVTGVPGEPDHFYFGSVNGGVWETNDAGRTWNPIFDAEPAGSIGAIAVAPSSPKTIYAGTGEADMRSDIAQGDGMYKSTDGGRTWTHIGLADSQQIGRVIVDPSNPDVVFVAALGHPYAANEERGVFRTRDGGTSWTKVLGPDANTGAIDLAFEPENPNVIYAALWATRRTPWSVYPPSTGPGGGLFKSTDGGDHWTELKGLPAHPGRIGVALSPAKPRRVYAVVDAEPGGGMYRSDDAGATWTKTSDDSRIWSRGWYFGGVTVEPMNADIVYSINVNVYRSVDGGKTFIPVKGAPGGDDYHQLWIDPQQPMRRILGVDQGCVVSVDAGRTWSSWFNQPTGQFYHVVTDDRFPYWVYGAQQDSGAAGVPSRTWSIDGINITQFREITAGGESDNVAPDPKDPDILYGGRVDRLNLRTMQTRPVDPALNDPESNRRTWTLPLVFSPVNPKALYFASQHLFRTVDGGNHWTIISPDLTRENPGVPPNLGAPEAALKTGTRMGVIYTIAPSRTNEHMIWTGTDDGLIWRTTDDGARWENVTPSALTPWSKVGTIESSHFDANTAYAAVDRHRLDDVKPYVYRTHDGGKTWQLIANGLPAFVNAVREDSARKGLLYAGTERGVSVSFDDGDHWQSLQLNLPATSVRDLDIHGNDLVIATHGRAFWVIDDVTPLRHVAEAPPYLVPPATAIRFRAAFFTGSPMPKDEAMAPNPPAGAIIDYVLPSAPLPAAPGEGGANAPGEGHLVTLEILDGSGAVVRQYSSADAAPKPNLAKLMTAAEWFVTPPALATTPGMHRFVWPIRYAAPAGTGRRGSGDGVWAPPGTYKVVLTVDGRKLEQPLTVVADPRVNLPAPAFAEQFAMARAVEATRADVAAALAGAEKLATNERARTLSGYDPATAAMWWLAPKPNTLRFVAGELDKLAASLDSADGAPSTDARDAWARVKPEADALLAQWKEIGK